MAARGASATTHANTPLEFWIIVYRPWAFCQIVLCVVRFLISFCRLWGPPSGRRGCPRHFSNLRKKAPLVFRSMYLLDFRNLMRIFEFVLECCRNVSNLIICMKIASSVHVCGGCLRLRHPPRKHASGILQHLPWCFVDLCFWGRTILNVDLMILGSPSKAPLRGCLWRSGNHS